MDKECFRDCSKRLILTTTVKHPPSHPDHLCNSQCIDCQYTGCCVVALRLEELFDAGEDGGESVVYDGVDAGVG